MSTVIEPQTSGWVLIAVATITVIPGILAAVFAWHAKTHAAETNDAVNHAHRSGTPRLYDLTLGLAEDMRDVKDWQARWDDLPPELRDAEHLTRRFDEIDGSLGELKSAMVRNDEVHSYILGQLEKEG